MREAIVDRVERAGQDDVPPTPLDGSARRARSSFDADAAGGGRRDRKLPRLDERAQAARPSARSYGERVYALLRAAGRAGPAAALPHRGRRALAAGVRHRIPGRGLAARAQERSRPALRRSLRAVRRAARARQRVQRAQRSRRSSASASEAQLENRDARRRRSDGLRRTTTSARCSTACRPRRASASASIAW